MSLSDMRAFVRTCVYEETVGRVLGVVGILECSCVEVQGVRVRRQGQETWGVLAGLWVEVSGWTFIFRDLLLELTSCPASTVFSDFFSPHAFV